jgi:hypothetical protein
VRTILTMILRLLVDSEAPEAVRGTLQPFLADQRYPFASGQELLRLLDREAQAPPGQQNACCDPEPTPVVGPAERDLSEYGVGPVLAPHAPSTQDDKGGEYPPLRLKG